MKYISLLLFFTFICTISTVYCQGWTAQTSGVTTDLYSIFFVDGGVGWAVGLNGATLLKTTDAGVTWASIDVHTAISTSCKSLYFIDSNIGWTVTDLGVYKTTDGGTTWVHQYTGFSTMWSIYFVDSNTGWAVGEEGTVLRTTNGGTNWTKDTIGTISDKWYSVYFVDSNTGWAVGWYGGIYKSTDGGANWTGQGSLADDWRSVCFSDDVTGWVVGDGGKIKKTTNGGTNWTAQTSGTTVDLKSVSFIDNNNGWAVGGNPYFSPYQVIIHTTDGGANWTSQASGVTKALYSICMINQNTGWIAGGGGTILRTLTGGNPTSVQENGTQPHTFALHQNYPNPFNPSTTINYQLAKTGYVKLTVFDLLGREVATLVNENQSAGNHKITFNAQNSTSGMYFYRLTTGNFTQIMKMTLMK
jgi:photosystem II stability/assembly factor-like uncharacterized protein